MNDGRLDIAGILEDHERRLSRLEKDLVQGTKRARKTAPSVQSPARSSLPKHILALRDSGFFGKPQTAEDVHEELSPTYHCEPNRVAVALGRLAQRRLLRKASLTRNGRSYQAFVW